MGRFLMSRLIILFFIVFFGYMSGLSAEEDLPYVWRKPLPDNTEIYMPIVKELKIYWAYWNEEPLMIKADNLVFDVDGETGYIWIGNHKSMVSPNASLLINIDKNYDDLAFVQGNVVMSANGYLGSIELSEDNTKHMYAKYNFVRRRTKLPKGSFIDVVAAIENKRGLYLINKNPNEKGRYGIYFLKIGKTYKETKKYYILSDPVKVHSVSGDGIEGYYSTADGGVAYFNIKDKKIKPIFKHGFDVLQIEWDKKNNMWFYATAKGVDVCVKPDKCAAFIKTPNPKIRFRNGKLYVMFYETQGVIVVENLWALKEYIETINSKNEVEVKVRTIE